jgi:NAD-dependent DNA ligase
MKENETERQEIRLDKFLQSLKIKGLTRRKAKKIAKFCDYEFFDFCMALNQSDEGFTVIKGINEKLNTAIKNKFQELDESGEIKVLSTLQFVTPKRYKSNCGE